MNNLLSPPQCYKLLHKRTFLELSPLRKVVGLMAPGAIARRRNLSSLESEG